MRAALYLFPLLFCLVSFAGCAREPAGEAERMRDVVNGALARIDLDSKAISLPKLPYPVATAGRLGAIDRCLSDPLSMLELSRKMLIRGGAVSIPGYLSNIFEQYGLRDRTGRGAEKISNLSRSAAERGPGFGPDGIPDNSIIRQLSEAADLARSVYQASGPRLTQAEYQSLRESLESAFEYHGSDPAVHRFMEPAYHTAGSRIDLSLLAGVALELLTALDQAGVMLLESGLEETAIERMTPFGAVRIAGRGDDRHTGQYFLLIDLGGNDLYEDVRGPDNPGQISIVIDVAGNDTIRWHAVSGPGAGNLGIGLWMDMAGEDVYRGNNLGVGAGILGIGVLWDKAGNDTYDSGAMTQGAGLYGIGILIDEQGDDTYSAAFNSQGYGGSGGIGVHIDLDGNDRYECGGRVPDQNAERARRHGSRHYVSMCQGYAFGLRDDISGGIGLLLDRMGSDTYKADLFSQGGAYWFGLGMLVDGEGDDRYNAFEHCQGESLHLAAGFLGDLGGNDVYTGYEHCQGVGMDRAVGFLFDDSGDDTYSASNESQGAGLKNYGVGLLVDKSGDDRYLAVEESQGYAQRPASEFPESYWPVGILLDLGGDNLFEQAGVASPDAKGRIVNRQGIAFAR